MIERQCIFAAMRAIEAARQAFAAKRGVAIREELVNADAPAQCATEITETLAQACAKHQLASMPTESTLICMARKSGTACCAPTRAWFVERGGKSLCLRKASVPRVAGLDDSVDEIDALVVR